MKLRRLAALELLGALRSLDGLALNGQFSAFTFTTDALEKIVDNIIALRADAQAKATALANMETDPLP